MKCKNFYVVLATVLVLSFVAVFSAGAQELKFDGYINSGFGVVLDNGDGSDPSLMVYGVDSESNIGRFRLNGAYTNEAKNAGANFRFQVQRHPVTTNIPSVPYAYGWVKPVDMLNIKFGLVDDGTWATADFFYNDDQGEGAGVLARVTPMPGLDIGIGGYVAGTTGGGDNNIFSGFSSSGITLKDAKYTFNAAYAMENTFRFMVSFRPENAPTDKDENPLPSIGGSGGSQFLAELRIFAVDGLTAVVVGQFQNLTEDADMNFNFYETFGYKLGDINVGLNAAQFIPPSGGDADPTMLFNPWVTYSMNEGKLVPRLDINFIMGGTLGSRTNYNRKSYGRTGNSDNSALGVRPSIKINLDSRNSLEIGDSLYYNLTKDADPSMVNAFYFDFVARF